MPAFDDAYRSRRAPEARGTAAGRPPAHPRAHADWFTVLRRRFPPMSGRAIGLADVALFTHHLAMLIEAGLPILQALDAVAEQTEDPQMQRVIREAMRAIETGRPLSVALSRHPGLFSPVYVGLMRNGEVSGRLGEALGRLAAHLERDLEFRRKVRDALLYPAFVLVLAAVVVAIFMTYIIPAFERVYRGATASLPLMTQGLLAVSTLFRANLPLLVVAGGLLLIPPVRRKAAQALAAPARRLAMRVPHAGALAQIALVSRFTHAMGALLQSGVPLMAALEVAAGSAGGGADGFGGVVELLKRSVNQGRRLSEGMRECGQFPPMVVRMIALGEESGRLDVMMTRAGEVLDREFEVRMRRLLAFLEPALTLMLGAVVGMIMLALYLPIFGLGKALVR